MNNRLLGKLFLLICLMIILFNILGILSIRFKVENDRIIIKDLFRHQEIFWSDITAIVLSPLSKGKKRNIIVTTDKSVLRSQTFNNVDEFYLRKYIYTLKNRKFNVFWLINDYKILVKHIIEKSINNKGIIIDSKVYEMIK